MPIINSQVKPFKATAFKNGAFVEVSDADLKGKWSVVFFYPADFTFVCPTELEDLTISRNFDVLIEEAGLADRGTFVINPEGQIKIVEINDGGVGRDASELLRKIKAAQYVAAHPGEVCPAKWKEGEATLAPSLDLVGKI